MSVGHVQRAIDAAGIPTVGVYVASFGHLPSLMGVSRALITHHPMGRPLGAPHDSERQAKVVRAALSLLTSTSQTIEEHPGTYRTSS